MWLLISALIAVSPAAVHVVDGDTIRYADKTWRLKGFDTPETFLAKCASERMLGIVARNKLRELIDKASTVEIEDDQHLDKYRRSLGTLMIDGKDAAALMVEGGVARVYSGREKRLNWCALKQQT
jgi:micrococcal nuclease